MSNDRKVFENLYDKMYDESSKEVIIERLIELNETIGELEDEITMIRDTFTYKYMELLKEQNKEMLGILIWEYNQSILRNSEKRYLREFLEKITGKSIDEILGDQNENN